VKKLRTAQEKWFYLIRFVRVTDMARWERAVLQQDHCRVAMRYDAENYSNLRRFGCGCASMSPRR